MNVPKMKAMGIPDTSLPDCFDLLEEDSCPLCEAGAPHEHSHRPKPLLGGLRFSKILIPLFA